MQFIKNILVSLGRLLNVFPQPLSDRADLLAVLKKLRPVDSGIDLIRVGPESDGGYLIPNDLDGIQALFSPGVSSESRFELYFANLGIDVLMADASVEGPSVDHQKFHFQKVWLGANSHHLTVSLDDFVKNFNFHRIRSKADDRDYILQMDIEGAEYETLLAASRETLDSFRIVIIEFHNLHHLWAKSFFRIADAVIAKLTNNHIPVHLHINNCCGSLNFNGLEIPRTIEVTFLRRDRVRNGWCGPGGDLKEFTHLPHFLDRDCVEKKDTLQIPKYWHE